MLKQILTILIITNIIEIIMIIIICNKTLNGKALRGIIREARPIILRQIMIILIINMIINMIINITNIIMITTNIIICNKILNSKASLGKQGQSC